MIRGAARNPVNVVLELGSGGNASHMKGAFALTLIEPADGMRQISRAQPRVRARTRRHALRQARPHPRGGLRPQAVFVHYAVMYMTTERGLRVILATVAAQLEPGGLALVAPDAKTETFKEATEHGNGEGADGRRALYLQWSLPPEPVETVSEIERLGAKAVGVQDGVSKVDECEQTADAAAEGLGGPTRSSTTPASPGPSTSSTPTRRPTTPPST